jgi:hypothetical protein
MAVLRVSRHAALAPGVPPEQGPALSTAVQRLRNYYRGGWSDDRWRGQLH